MDRDSVMAELTALHTSRVSDPEPSATPFRPLPPPIEYVDVDDDRLIVVSPSGAPYAAVVAKPKKKVPLRKREDFPRLETPLPQENHASIKKRLGAKKLVNSNTGKRKTAARVTERARSARVGPRFEVTTDGKTSVNPLSRSSLTLKSG